MFAFSTLITFILTVGMFGGMLLLPLFLQNLRGLGAAETGLILISQVLPMMIAMPVIGKLVDSRPATDHPDRPTVSGAGHVANGRARPEHHRHDALTVAGCPRVCDGLRHDAVDDSRPQRDPAGKNESR